MKLWKLALICIAVAVVGYIVRGPAYIGDYENGGLHDWVTVLVTYAGLIGFVGVCCVALFRLARRLARVARRT